MSVENNSICSHSNFENEKFKKSNFCLNREISVEVFLECLLLILLQKNK